MVSFPRQLPFVLDHQTRFSRDDLFVTAANAEAVALIDRWPDWPSTVVVMAGPPGSGKSHLAAVWRDAAIARVVDPAFFGTHNGVDGPLVVDGIGDASFDESGLFHLINAARGAGTNLLLTTRSFPAAWGVHLPDLASRLKAATVIEIHEPDDDLLSGVIVKLFADRQIAVDPFVVQFLVRRMERSLSSAAMLVDRLDRAAMEKKTRISRALAGEVMAAYEKESGRPDAGEDS